MDSDADWKFKVVTKKNFEKLPPYILHLQNEYKKPLALLEIIIGTKRLEHPRFVSTWMLFSLILIPAMISYLKAYHA